MSSTAERIVSNHGNPVVPIQLSSVLSKVDIARAMTASVLRLRCENKESNLSSRESPTFEMIHQI
jgi:hypothetical protein